MRCTSQLLDSFAHEIKANVRSAIFSLPGILPGQSNGQFRHLQLRGSAKPSNALNGMAVVVACSEIHLGVNVSGVGAQCLLHDALSFDKLAPIHGIQKSKAAD